MYESHYPTTTELLNGQRTRRNLLTGLLITTVLLIFGIMGTLFVATELPGGTILLVGLGIFLLLAMHVAVWNNPRLGLYIYLGGAITTQYVNFSPRVPTSLIPFLPNLSTFGSRYGMPLNGLVFSIAEILVVFTCLTWIVRSIVTRDLRIKTGAFFPWIAAYILMVVWGYFHGVTTGGDKTMALWETRAQGHYLFAYLMATNLITERKHVYPLLWLTVLGIGINSLIGASIFAENGFKSSVEGIVTHEESLFTNVILFILFICLIGRVDRKLTWATLLLAPFAIMTTLANQRRSGIAAFIIAFLPLLPILWFAFPHRRRQVSIFAVVFSLFSAVYLPVAWNSSGAWALPARAIKSNRTPSARDNASNEYRLAEIANIKWTRDLDPWRGIGYGKRFAMVHALPTVTTDFMSFMPHNSVMWVWMRIGHIGFFCFMMMIATILLRGVQIIKETKDSLLQMAGMLGILSLLMIFTFGKYDQVLINYRVMIMTGVFVGVLSVLDRLKRDSQQASLSQAIIIDTPLSQNTGDE